MSDIDPSAITSTGELREQTDEWIVKNTSRTHNPHLHLPHAESTDDRPLPLCLETYPRADIESWVSKPVSVFPPKYRPICSRCRAHHDFGQELGPQWDVYDD